MRTTTKSLLCFYNNGVPAIVPTTTCNLLMALCVAAAVVEMEGSSRQDQVAGLAQQPIGSLSTNKQTAAGERVVVALYQLVGQESAEEEILPIRWVRAVRWRVSGSDSSVKYYVCCRILLGV